VDKNEDRELLFYDCGHSNFPYSNWSIFFNTILLRVIEE